MGGGWDYGGVGGGIEGMMWRCGGLYRWCGEVV